MTPKTEGIFMNPPLFPQLLRLVLQTAALLSLTAAPLYAATPLLMEGKKTLYQKVISRPGAVLRQSPDAAAAIVNDKIKTFTVFYVYDRRSGMLEVGVSPTRPDGWLREEESARWDQALTLMFTERTGRDRILFFKDAKALEELCAAQDMEARLKKLEADVDAARGGQSDPALPVLAIEPPDTQGAVVQNRFYLMPVLKSAEPFEGVKFLEVASIDPALSPKNADTSGPPRTGIAFVIDTTISMKPYIDQSLNVIRSIYDEMEKSSLADSVGFAVVAFRNSATAKPGLEYLTTVVSDFKTTQDRKSLETELAKVGEAKSSSHSFNEDALAGIKRAVDDLSWGPFASRMIILISDAGPLPADDANASVRMDVRELADYAKARGIWLNATHIKSPAGATNHGYAEKAYRSLTRLSDERSNYLAIAAPTPKAGAEQFATVTKTLAAGLMNMVKSTAEGKMLTRPANDPATTKTEEQAADLGRILGYAMQLEYLGRRKDTRAPSLVASWIADTDLAGLAADRRTPNIRAAVLLTKNQLSDLQQQLKIIIDNAERTKKTDSRDFFQGILSASARMVRDPSRLGSAEAKSLSELGVLGEFLEGLPYKSDIMLLREEDWYRMSVCEQTAFVNRLKSRIARYEEYDRDVSGWQGFGSPLPGDWVYRVPLTMLP